MGKALSAVKNALVPRGVLPRTIPLGLLRGLRMNLDLTNGMQIYAGLAERELAPWFTRLAQGIRTAFDVGASEGVYSLFFLHKTPAAQVFAFEPDPEARQRLRANLRLNGSDDTSRFQLVPKFVGSCDDETRCMLDSFAGAAAEPVLVKLDIEGHEVDALSGAIQLLDRSDVRWIVEAHSRELEQTCQQRFRDRGYLVVPVRRAAFRVLLPEHRPAAHNSWFVAFRPQLAS